MDTEVDVLIVGGGLVGAALACALDGTPLSVVQIEAQAPRSSAAPSYDERNLALARRSVRTLDALGVMAHARAEANPIRHVHVSSRGDFGAVRLHAEDYGLDALGMTVPARAIGAALEQRLATVSNWRRLAPATAVGVGPAGERIAVDVEHGGARSRIAARLLVGADGTESFVRSALGIRVDTRDYGQTAFVATVTPGKAHEDWAYERFGPTGPLALLPLSGERCGLVYTDATDESARLAALDDAAFLAAANERFGWRLGRWRRVGRRQPWALRRVEANALVAERAVLIGNAAQTIHPIGAQGFNLGLRDVMALRDRIVAAADPGAGAVLVDYATAREPDRRATAQWSDTLVRGFALPGLASLARGAALAVLERTPLLKQDLAYAMMGYRGEAMP